jgi:O-antigen/teichoic acid export membrane protein
MKLLAFIQRTRERPIFKEISWYGAAQIFTQFFMFVGVMVISRYFGPINLGLYSFVQNYLAVFLSLMSGMDFYYQWKIAKSEDRHKDVIEYLSYKITVGITLSIAGALIAAAILPHDVALMTVILLAPLWLHAFSAFSLYAFATQQARLVSSIQMVSTIIIFILKMGLVVLSAPLISFVVVSSIEIILSTALIALYFLLMPEWRRALKTYTIFSVSKSFSFLYSIKSSVLAMALWQILLRADQLILALVTNAYHLGIYVSAVKIAEVPNFLASTLYVALVSRVAHMALHNDASSKHRLKKVMFLYAGVSVFIALGVIVFAPLLVKILYGEKFIESIPVLRVYVLSLPAMFLFFFFFSVYGMKNVFAYQSYVYAMAIGLNALGIIVLTPLFGLMGTAFATVLSYTAAVILFYIHSRRAEFIL